MALKKDTENLSGQIRTPTRVKSKTTRSTAEAPSSGAMVASTLGVGLKIKCTELVCTPGLTVVTTKDLM